MSSLLNVGPNSGLGRYGNGDEGDHTSNSNSNGNYDEYATIMTEMTSRPGSLAQLSSSLVLLEESGATRVEGDQKLNEVPGAVDLTRAAAPRRARPTSFDGFRFPAVGAGGSTRMRFESRYESMVNLGASSSSAGTIDSLAARDSIVDDSGALWHRLVLREDGKPPIYFVSVSYSSLQLSW